MNCPFCQNKLQVNEYKSGNSYYCDHESCVIRGDMPRFNSVYDSDGNLVHLVVMSENLRVEQNYAKRSAVIWRIRVAFKEDPVEVSCTIPFDFNDPESIFTRAKKLLIFS